jgi:hypothetical protein
MVGVAKKEINPLEFPDMVCDLSELVMRNYLLGFEVGMCLWKRNIEFFIRQMNQWAAMQQLYNGTINGLYGKSPSETRALFESFFNELTKDATDFAEKNWLLLNDCINLMLDLD